MDRGYNRKRPHPLYEEEMVEQNVRQKWTNQRGYTGHDVVFRILCPSQKIGFVIGKGSIIKTMRQDFGVKVQVADTILGLNERVIIISALDRGSEQGRGRNSRDRGRFQKRDEFSNIHDKNLSAVQEVLFKVHARIAMDYLKTLGGVSSHEEDSSQQVVLRMLVPTNQTSCLVGTSTISEIRIFPTDQRTKCAMATDVIVEVCGDAQFVRKALFFISSQLQDYPFLGLSPSFVPLAPAFVSVNDHEQLVRDSNDDLVWLRAKDLENRPDDICRKEGRDLGKNKIVFRLLCPSDMVGFVISTKDTMISNLYKETGASIIIDGVVLGSDEHIVTVSAFELPRDSLSPALEAMIELQRVISEQMEGERGGIVTARLLVPTNKINCLTGKGHSISEDILRATRADIRLLPKVEFPPCASKKEDELVEIMGDTTVIHMALRKVLGILRNNASVHKPVGGGRGVYNDVSSLQSDNCSSDSSNMQGERKSQGKSLDSIQWVAKTISQTMVKKMATIMETMVEAMGGKMVETMARTMRDTIAETMRDAMAEKVVETMEETLVSILQDTYP